MARSDETIRVLSICNVDGAGGGAEKIVLHTAAKANPDRLKITVCCFRRADDKVYDIDSRAADLGIDYCEVVTKSKFDRSVLPILRQIVRDRMISIVHAHGYKPAYFAWQLRRKENILPMSTSHGWTGVHFRERFLYYPLDRRLIRSFPLAVAVSSQIREVLIKSGCDPQKVRVLLNGIDPHEHNRNPHLRTKMRSSFGLNDKHIVLGAAGRLEPQKRFDILINVFNDLRVDRPHLKLLIAGEGSLLKTLQNQIDTLGLSDHCTLLGHCSDIKAIYQAFDLLVQSSDYEGTPTVVVEAMALELPVVATDAGGTRELVEDGVHGLIVPKRNPRALTAAINETLINKEATKQRIMAARKRVENELSFATRMLALEHCYRDIISTDRDGTKLS